MEPKYTSGQKVRIVSVSSPHGGSRYPELEKYVNETGEIVDSHLSKYEIHGQTTENWAYTVYIVNGSIETTIMEDALESLPDR